MEGSMTIKTLFAFICIILPLSLVSFQRLAVYKNEFTLWTDIVKKSSLKARPHNNLAAVYKDKKMLDYALNEYLLSIKLNPRYVPGHGNLASIYYEMGRLDEAEKELKIAMAVDSPYKGLLHRVLGFVYIKKGALDDAAREFKEVIKLIPNYPDAKRNIAVIFTNEGFLYTDKGDFERALMLHRMAVFADSGYPDAHFGLAQAYEAFGQKEEAIKQWQEYLRLAPSDEPFRKDAMKHLERLGE